MKMDGLYLAVLMDLGWFPLKWLLPFPGLNSPATYARGYMLRKLMIQAQKKKLLRINSELIQEARGVIESQFKTGVIGAPIYVDVQLLHKWWGKVKSFGHQLGPASRPWQEMFSADVKQNTLVFARMVLGTLEAIRHEIENDHLETITQLVKAETLADLLDQAEHLFENGYHLPAGVIGRAVLEEYLRTTCDILNCGPAKKRPTIKDYNLALYGIQHYSKVKMKQIDVLASIGNDAAHNNPNLDSSDVKKLLADLPEVIDSTGI
jgi:hypothetical protein